MIARRLIAFVAMLGALTPIAAFAAPTRDANFSAKLASLSILSGPCAPGAIYESACDVNHDGVVDVFDIQLTAGHWNQTGTWMSDNDHNHLGQTWTGSYNPIRLTGTFGSPDLAPLVLSNNHPLGNGLTVASAGGNGVDIVSAGSAGIHVGSAAGTAGVSVDTVGNPSSVHYAFPGNGFEVAGAENIGFYVGRADADGVFVNSAGDDGVRVHSATNYGLHVGTAGNDGLWVEQASGVGAWANTTQASGQWGFYTPDKIRGSNVTLESLSLVAQVSGPDGLSAGDIVTAAGLADPLSDSIVPLALVRLADAKTATGIVGVVEGRMALTAKPQREGEQDIEPVMELRSAEGPAQPGDYVALTVLGVAQVKVQEGAEIQPGQRLTASDIAGRVRALRTETLNGMVVSEGAPVIGTALTAPEPGQDTILVFVTLR